MDNAKAEMTPVLSAANRKLAAGARIKLDIAIGIVKRNNERPPVSCSGVSVTEKTAVRRSRIRQPIAQNIGD